MMKLQPLISLYCLLALHGIRFANAQYWQSRYVSVDKNDQLAYIADERGNTIPDFSRVGYHHGDIPIPDVGVVRVIGPATFGSSQDRIQAAIDELAMLQPDEYGFRGTILLTAGDYEIPGTLYIRTSGIVLRGVGVATNLIASGVGKRTLLQITGKADMQEIPDSRSRIAGDYVPSGTFRLQVAHPGQYAVGDPVMIEYHFNDDWIKAIRMDSILAREGTKQWKAKEYTLHFERKVVGVENHHLIIDNPIMMPIDSQYGYASIYKYRFDGRLSEVGVEHMQFTSAYADDTDENHGWIAVEMNNIENGWVRNVVAMHFGYAAVSLNGNAKNITVRDCQSLNPKSVITGGRRYSFNNNGQQNLFSACMATEGRHDYVTGARVCGPNVFYNCKAQRAHADIGPHHRWAVGTLYDHIETDGEINVQDRGNWGSGHGWAGVTQVLWNCKAATITVQSPWASGKNYAIGGTGRKTAGRLGGRPDGEWEGFNNSGLRPASLYKAQLSQRQQKK